MGSTGQPSHAPPGWRGPTLTAAILAAAVCVGAVYANLSFAVRDGAGYRFFPPFQPYHNGNTNDHLLTGTEYGHIARALTAGEGFADPFGARSGPTAWMPPVLPALLAGLLWACDGNVGAVTAVVVFLQVEVLIGTGLLVLALVRRTTRRVGARVAAALYLAALVGEFRLCFQSLHDCWLVLLAMDLLLAGLCWFEPLRRWDRAALWGLFAGLAAQVNPAVGLAWVLLSLPAGLRQRAWSRLALAALVAGLTLTPWTVRNYLVFGHPVPVKSNLAYELYQSQCLQSDGLFQSTTVPAHPNSGPNKERQEYEALGERGFLERKWQQFCQAVTADPMDFADRVASRFLGATLWYVPFDRADEARRPAVLWASRALHPLPFLAVLVLALSAFFKPLSWPQWAVIGLYVIYLLPYVMVSYYERYTVPLLGVKVLLVVWAAERLLSSLALWTGSADRGQRPGGEAG